MTTTPTKREYPALPDTWVKRQFFCNSDHKSFNDCDSCGAEVPRFTESMLHAYADPLLDEIERLQKEGQEAADAFVRQTMKLLEAETARWQDEFLKASATIERQREVMRQIATGRLLHVDQDWAIEAIAALQAELEKKE